MTDENSNEEEGGEGSCFAHLICPDCGVVLDGSEHAQNCVRADPKGNIDAFVDDESGPND